MNQGLIEQKSSSGMIITDSISSLFFLIHLFFSPQSAQLWREVCLNWSDLQPCDLFPKKGPLPWAARKWERETDRCAEKGRRQITLAGSIINRETTDDSCTVSVHPPAAYPDTNTHKKTHINKYAKMLKMWHPLHAKDLSCIQTQRRKWDQCFLFYRGTLLQKYPREP